MRTLPLAFASLIVVGLAACSEQPQTAKAAYNKADKPQYAGADNAFMAPGWQPGDADSWRKHLQARTRGQNEYTRTSN